GQGHPDHRRDAGLHRPLTRFATPRDPSPAHGSAPVDDEKVAPFGRWTVAHRVPYRRGGAPSESTTTRRWPWAHWKARSRSSPAPHEVKDAVTRWHWRARAPTSSPSTRPRSWTPFPIRSPPRRTLVQGRTDHAHEGA